MNSSADEQEIEITEAMVDDVADILAERMGIGNIVSGVESLIAQLFENQQRLEARIRQLEGENTVQVMAHANVDIRQGTMQIIHTRSLPESLRVPDGIWADREVKQNAKRRA